MTRNSSITPGNTRRMENSLLQCHGWCGVTVGLVCPTGLRSAKVKLKREEVLSPGLTAQTAWAVAMHLKNSPCRADTLSYLTDSCASPVLKSVGLPLLETDKTFYKPQLMSLHNLVYV